MQRVYLAMNLGDATLDQALALAPAHDIAGLDVDLVGASVAAGEIDREPIAAQAVDRQPCVAPAVAAPLDIHGSVGLLHRFMLHARGPPGTGAVVIMGLCWSRVETGRVVGREGLGEGC